MRGGLRNELFVEVQNKDRANQDQKKVKIAPGVSPGFVGPSITPDGRKLISCFAKGAIMAAMTMPSTLKKNFVASP